MPEPSPVCFPMPASRAAPAVDADYDPHSNLSSRPAPTRCLPHTRFPRYSRRLSGLLQDGGAATPGGAGDAPGQHHNIAQEEGAEGRERRCGRRGDGSRRGDGRNGRLLSAARSGAGLGAQRMRERAPTASRGRGRAVGLSARGVQSPCSLRRAAVLRLLRSPYTRSPYTREGARAYRGHTHTTHKHTDTRAHGVYYLR